MSGSGDEDASRIKEAGWRQGSVLSPDHVAFLRNRKLLPANYDSETTLFIVLSHDCDVTNSSFSAEPLVELLVANALPDKGIGNFYSGKNPRVYHLFPEFSSEVCYECLVHNRLNADRHVLLDYSPDNARSVSGNLLMRLRAWIARRYIRDALPDNFNKRTREAQRFVEKKQKETSQLLIGIYLLLTDEELADDEKYEITITSTMLDDDYADVGKRTKVTQYLIELANAFNEHPGISIDHNENNVISEDDMTVGDLRVLKRWDTDSLSLRLDPPSDVPPYE